MSKPKLSTREYLKGIAEAAKMSMRVAPWAVAAKLFGALLNSLLPLATIYFSAQTTTELAAAFNGNQAAGEKALLYIMLTIGAALITTVWSSIDNYIQTMMRYIIDGKVSTLMYEHLLNLEFWRYDDKETRDTYDKAIQFGQFYAFIFDRLTSLLTSIFTVISATIALIIFSPWIGTMVLISLIPTLILQVKLSRIQIAHWNKNTNIRRSQSHIEWSLLQPSTITELRLNNLIHHLLELRNKYRDKDERERMQFERKYIKWQIVANVIETVASLGALVWTALNIISHIWPLGHFVLVQMTVTRVQGGVKSFIGELNRMDEDIAQLYDYQRFMSFPTQDSATDTLSHTPHTIMFDNVSFHYHGSKTKVLKNINLTIQKNQHIAIVGENGAGKSTFIKLLLGLYRPSAGKVSIDGVDLRSYTPSSWHRHIAVLQQDFIQYTFTDVKHNVLFGDINKQFDQQQYDEALRDTEAYDFIQKLPEKDATISSTWLGNDDDKGVNLSGGQWQRIALARSFYRDAPIIILDEPTSAIDALAESRIFRRLFKEKNKTIVTISHRLTTVSKADVIYVFDDGKIVEKGTHEELIAKNGHYVRLFESQL